MFSCTLSNKQQDIYYTGYLTIYVALLIVRIFS